jgi:hypothetical protein
MSLVLLAIGVTSPNFLDLDDRGYFLEGALSKDMDPLVIRIPSG